MYVPEIIEKKWEAGDVKDVVERWDAGGMR